MVEYSAKAQPFLDALGAAVFRHSGVRDWLINETRHATEYRGARILQDEQARARGLIKQPFFCNYWCGNRIGGREICACSVPGSTAKETDALFFLEAESGRRLAVHVEFKHPNESLKPGQAESYPRRAACWATGQYRTAKILPHHDWVTVIIAEPERLSSPDLAHFCRRIGHDQAARMIPGWPG